MQKNHPLRQHRLGVMFAGFCKDMEILPPYTPIFMIDIRGRIVEKRKLPAVRGDFSHIVPLISQRDIEQMMQARDLYDVYILEASFGEGKDFIVVSEDKLGFSRCVVCSCSDAGCTRLNEYLEKLSCYKDYLDSFAQLSFYPPARTPVMRIFRSRISGVSELLRLSEHGASGRRLSFPLKLALEKTAQFAKMTTEGVKGNILLDTVDTQFVVNAPESFFKLVICLMGLELRESHTGNVHVSADRIHGASSIGVGFSFEAECTKNEMYWDALIKAFEMSGFEACVTKAEKEISFHFLMEPAKEKTKILSDSVRISQEIESILSESVLKDLYFTVADI